LIEKREFLGYAIRHLGFLRWYSRSKASKKTLNQNPANCIKKNISFFNWWISNRFLSKKLHFCHHFDFCHHFGLLRPWKWKIIISLTYWNFPKFYYLDIDFSNTKMPASWFTLPFSGFFRGFIRKNPNFLSINDKNHWNWSWHEKHELELGLKWKYWNEKPTEKTRFWIEFELKIHLTLLSIINLHFLRFFFVKICKNRGVEIGQICCKKIRWIRFLMKILKNSLNIYKIL
jgi:hypothetical protein